MSILKNSLIGLDLWFSTLTGGKPGETLSGRAGSAYLQGKLKGRFFVPIIDFVMWATGAYPTISGHCVHAIQGDIKRAEAVEKSYAE